MSVKISNNTIYAAKAIIYRNSLDGREFLVTKEKDTGLYGFVGGAQDEGDMTIEETMQRELLEEVGLRGEKLLPTSITYAFTHTDQNSPRFGKQGVLTLFLINYSGAPLILAEELEEIQWVSEGTALDLLKNSYSYWPELFLKVIEQL
jgi:8-oxo-dGTP pyrophosphatase MutT (NUDIX family)